VSFMPQCSLHWQLGRQQALRFGSWLADVKEKTVPLK
jgi:hypothetical protein